MNSIQIIGPQQYVQAIKVVMSESFQELSAEYYSYEHFTQTADILKKIKKPADIIFFAGYLPYTYAQPLLPHGSLCSYLHIGRDFVVKGLFMVLQAGYTLERLSIDTFNVSSVWRTFAELGLDKTKLQPLVIEHNESGLLAEVELILASHIHNYSVHKASCCMTGIYVVYKQLRELDIPCVYMLPTAARIEDSIRLAVLELAHLNELESSVAVLKISIDEYNEHSRYQNNNGQQAINRGNIIGRLYAFAEDVQGALVESNADCYWIFISNSRLLSVTDNLKELYIQNEIAADFAHTISIGIGYGKTIHQAQQAADHALKQAESTGSNRAWLAKDDTLIPMYNVSNMQRKEINVDNALLNLSENTGVSTNNIFKLLRVIQTYGAKKTFTARELSLLTGISMRTLNRILEKLEEHNYCNFIGKKAQPGAGRPSRLIRFKLKNLVY